MANYGAEQYYYDEEEDSEEIGMAPGEYFQKPGMGAMAQGKGGFGMGMGGAGAFQGGGGVSSASGVPFYGQSNKMPGAPTFLTGASALGGGPGAGGMGMGMGGGGGGFTYGMASQGGNLFGGPSAGASNPLGGGGGFTYGAASKGGALFGPSGGASGAGGLQFGTMGGAGGAAALFGGAGAGAVANDAPYSGYEIDLTKVKKSEPPTKPHELKTEEEKKREALEKKLAAPSGKSNLKLDKDEGASKKNVRFGKSTTYEVTGADESGESQDFLKKVSEPGAKKVIDEKDLSEGKNEKDKIREEIERQEREQLEQIQKMNQWKAKQDEVKAKEAKEGAHLKKF